MAEHRALWWSIPWLVKVPVIVLIGVGSGCKARQESGSSAVKDTAVATTAAPETIDPLVTDFETLAFDVNDVSILFPTFNDDVTNANGSKTTVRKFYPDVAFDANGAFDGQILWPTTTVFKRMMAFGRGDDFAENLAVATGNGAGGEGAALADVPSPDPRLASTAFSSANAGIRGSGGSSAALGLADNPTFTKRVRIGESAVGGAFVDDTDTAESQFVSPSKVDTTNHPTIVDITAWRVVSLRADFCAAPKTDDCQVEFRLIAQPIDAQSHVIDVSAHLVFRLGELDVATGAFKSKLPGVPSSITIKGLVQDLQIIKKLSLAIPSGATDGQPLGPHPGLLAEGATASGTRGRLASAVIALIKRYTAGGLSVVTTMQLTPGVELDRPWIFYQGEVVHGADGVQTWNPIAITGGSPQMSVRSAADGEGLTVKPANLSGMSIHDLMAAPSKTNFDTAYALDNPGKYGAADAAKVSVLNQDCVSCHATVTQLQAMRNNDDIGDAAKAINSKKMYVPADGITGYPSGAALPDTVYRFRDFGYFKIFQASGPQPPDKPLVMTRTVNESAELARFLNEDLMPKAAIYPGRTFRNPGFRCPSKPRTPALHAAIWDCYVTPFGGGDFRSCADKVCAAPSGN